MSKSLKFICTHCSHRFEKPPIYEEAAVIECPECFKTFIPNFFFYLKKEWIEPLAIAIVLALLIKRCFFEIYVIPTSSMEPNLHGFGHFPEDGGDKVLVSKLSYLWEEPNRWDIIVFKPPQDKKLYIKRMVAKGGDELMIRNGDLYIDGKISPKTKEAQEALLYTIYDSKASRNHLDHFEKFQKEAWVPEGNWDIKFNKFTFQGGSGNLRFNYPIDSRIASHYLTTIQKEMGYVQGKGGVSPTPLTGKQYYKVGDIKLEGKIKIIGDTGSLQIAVKENENLYALILDIKNNKIILKHNSSIKASKDFDLKSSEYLRFSISNIDGLIQASFDEEELNYINLEGLKETYTEKNGAFFLSDSSKFELMDIKVIRDIHYFGLDNGSVKIPKGTYFCLGDNVHQSSDSRDWGFVHDYDLKGKALSVIWPFRFWPGEGAPPQVPFISHRTRIKNIK